VLIPLSGRPARMNGAEEPNVMITRWHKRS
jgi:hypothetical protein